MSTRLLIFAKAPVAGMVKTRLIPALGAPGAAALAREMLAHMLAQANAAQFAAVEMCVSPSATDAVWLPWRALVTGCWSDQGEGDLGERMARAAQRVLATGDAVLLVGTDCPALDAGKLRRAAASLAQHDACMIPAHDGGYVLLGLRRFDASLFSNIAWSTAEVAQVTLARLAQLGWSVQVFAPLHDIDEPQDLPHVPSHWLRGMPEPAAQVP